MKIKRGLDPKTIIQTFSQEACQQAKQEANFMRDAISLYFRNERSLKEFICLRCGACCIWFDVLIGGLKLALADQYCPFFIPRSPKKQQGQIIWQEAVCEIHSALWRPPACRFFEKFKGFSGPCPIGRAVWLHTKYNYPQIKIPDWIELFLEIKPTLKGSNTACLPKIKIN